MGQIVQSLGAVVVGIFMIASAAYGIYQGMSRSALARADESLISMQTQIHQIFDHRYEGLDEKTAMTVGAIPSEFIRDGKLRNPWGGEIRITTVNKGKWFQIEFTRVPQKDCGPFALNHIDIFQDVQIDGFNIKGADMESIANMCASRKDDNEIRFTSD